MPAVIDVARARRETPGCENVLHFDNAGASLMPEPVVNRVISHLQLEASIGGYEAAEKEEAAVNQVYRSAAELLNCRHDELAVIENATRAWDMAFYSVPFKRGDRILTAKASYASNYIAFMQMARRKEINIDVIPDDEYGQLSVTALREMMDSDVKLIAITHVPTNGGLVNPAAKVGEIAREAGVLYLLDACQSVGQMPIDVDRIGCDILSATGRKFLRGPRGTGLLFVSSTVVESLEPPMLDLHAASWTARNQFEVRRDARRFENWETNVAAKVGLGVAIDYAMAWGIQRIWRRVNWLAESLRDQLDRLPGVTVHDKGEERCGIVSFTLKGVGADSIRAELRRQRINVSTSTIFSTRLDMADRQLSDLVRASVHYYNDEEEVSRFVSVVRNMS